MNLQVVISTPIVSVDWLHKHQEATNIIVLDGTINKVFNTSTYQIPKARFFDIKKRFSDTGNAFPSAFPTIEQFQKEARLLGVNQDSAIVVYDDKGIYSSARVWWMFKAFGFHNIAVLNGGFPEWQKAGYQIEPMTEYRGVQGNFMGQLSTEHMKFFEDVEQASKQKTHTIIDARSSGRFQCEVEEPRTGLRMGNIPNSVNLPYTDLLEDGLLKPKVALEKAFYMLAEKGDAIIFSCGSGITACVLALGATIAGYQNISVYDGSWTEWGTLVKA
ncbi:sulfurtransferase [Cognatitamlana onchidii]|uniref:sulfurtransferase n=1 Tax=Cognatitamlana onchidii TaxID=2562860 RepID=UPI001F3A320D|nr:sulfurtransferase [Algibacter onchidii]